MTATYSGIDPERFFGIDGYVGNTPLIRLRRMSELTGCEILGKAEFMNPAGSVKDRAAYGIITDAEAAGRVTPGGTSADMPGVRRRMRRCYRPFTGSDPVAAV